MMVVELEIRMDNEFETKLLPINSKVEILSLGTVSGEMDKIFGAPFED
jgi:hypothetical protein